MARVINHVDFSQFNDEELIEWYNSVEHTGSIDVNKFFWELNRRNINVAPLIRLAGLFPKEAKLVDGTLWNVSQKKVQISMVQRYYDTVYKINTFLNSLKQIQGKDLITYDYIHSQIIDETAGFKIKYVDSDQSVIQPFEVFIYYQHKDKIYPNIIPIEVTSTGYYLVFKRNTYDKGIHSVTLFDHRRVKVEKLEIGHYVKF